MRGGERERHSDAASVRGSCWLVLRASAAAFWCGERVRWRAGAVSVSRCGERVRRRAGAACCCYKRAGRRVGAAFGCCERAQRRMAGAAAFGCDERVLQASAAASCCCISVSWTARAGKLGEGLGAHHRQREHHFLDECMIGRNNTS